MPSRGLLVGFVILQEDVADRVVVLGLNSQVSASRLARLLLADPLGNEEGWEKELEKERARVQTEAAQEELRELEKEVARVQAEKHHEDSMQLQEMAKSI